MSSSTCDIELLLQCSSYVYGLSQDNKLRGDARYAAYNEAWDKADKTVRNKGYEPERAIAPQKAGGTGTTNLGAACFFPKSGKGPIVIAYRGTWLAEDYWSDAHVAVRGVVNKALRDAASKFYKEVQEKYPDREIILTGHSLGGNIASDVAAKVYSKYQSKLGEQKKEGGKQQEEVSKPRLQVRTFNSANLCSNERKKIEENSELAHNFANYRTARDLVSNESLEHGIGNIYSFAEPKAEKQSSWEKFGSFCFTAIDVGAHIMLPIFWQLCSRVAEGLSAHKVRSLERSLPTEVLLSKVGEQDEVPSELNQIKEELTAIPQAYECRIRGQWFSSFRRGSDNLDEINGVVEKVLEHLQAGNTEVAKSEASKAASNGKEKKYGKFSNHYLGRIKALTEQLHESKENKVIAKKKITDFFKLPSAGKGADAASAADLDLSGPSGGKGAGA